MESLRKLKNLVTIGAAAFIIGGCAVPTMDTPYEYDSSVDSDRPSVKRHRIVLGHDVDGDMSINASELSDDGLGSFRGSRTKITMSGENVTDFWGVLKGDDQPRGHRIIRGHDVSGRMHVDRTELSGDTLYSAREQATRTEFRFRRVKK